MRDPIPGGLFSLYYLSDIVPDSTSSELDNIVIRLF